VISLEVFSVRREELGVGHYENSGLGLELKRWFSEIGISLNSWQKMYKVELKYCFYGGKNEVVGCAD